MLESSGKFVTCVERCGKNHGASKMLFALREQSPVPWLAPEQRPQQRTGRPGLSSPEPLCALPVPGSMAQPGTRQTLLSACAAGPSDSILSEGFVPPRTCNHLLWKLTEALKQDCCSVFSICACHGGT